MDEWMVANKV